MIIFSFLPCHILAMYKNFCNFAGIKLAKYKSGDEDRQYNIQQGYWLLCYGRDGLSCNAYPPPCKDSLNQRVSRTDTAKIDTWALPLGTYVPGA